MFRCTKETPWRPGLGTPVAHEDAYEHGEQVDGWPGGDVVTMRCPNCHHEWHQELAQ